MTQEEKVNVNPTWRLCKDELPDRPCECICHDGERMFFAKWFDYTPQGLSGWQVQGLTLHPIAWIPIPELNLNNEQ